ncbi:hypothetical protein [Terrarubrum flagellatum]|uniref:hypothetical protein n=1 Tax=Terrirubrum flagellatum TaxID=2895980 RepID=UPI0031455744
MFHLKKLEDEYADELVDPIRSIAARRVVLGRDEKRLKDAIEFYGELKSAARSPQVASVPNGPGRVRALANFHEQQQRNTTLPDEVARLIIRLRLWLHRQGANVSRDGAVLWPDAQPMVRYDNELQQVLTLVRIQAGLLTTIERRPLDTAKMVTAFSGPGFAIYVVSAEGNLHVSSHSAGLRHHSSLLAGAPVACAGEIKVDNGRIMMLTNKSGHYVPAPFYLAQVIRHFAQQGIAPDSYPVKAFTKAGIAGQYYNSAREFLQATIVPILPVVPAPPPVVAPDVQNPFGYAGSTGLDFVSNPRYVDPPADLPRLKGEYVYEIPGFG